MTAASEGRTVQSIDTFERYHPEQSWGAGVHLYVTIGTASARGAETNPISRRRPTAAASQGPWWLFEPSRAPRTLALGISLGCACGPITHLPRLQLQGSPSTVIVLTGRVNVWTLQR